LKIPAGIKTFALALSAFTLGAFVVPLVSHGGSTDAHRKSDAILMQSLLCEQLSDRSFSFSEVAQACSGKKVIPLDNSPPHLAVVNAIETALSSTIAELNLPDSPVRQLRRINEASRFFEEGILARINSMPGFHCEVPSNRTGVRQRSGYPDLKITHLSSGLVFYLDPKLVEQGSAASTFRSFYFEPKNETLKITDDAVHLLVGIEHDGKNQLWTFTGWRLIDVSSLHVRLKAEFQASNAEIYQKSVLSLPHKPR
jgi:hypothetical protein